MTGKSTFAYVCSRADLSAGMSPKPPPRHRLTLDEAAKALGIDLLPWQREAGERILAGERIAMQGGRRAGRAALQRVINLVTNIENGNES